MLETYHTYKSLEAGCDEAGRGALAGPVFAAAVIFPENYSNELINDSKKITANLRQELKTIIEKEALAWAVAKVMPEEIDKINILNASIKAMNAAVKKLKVKPKHLLIDGNRFINSTQIPHVCVVHGDALYLSIAAASILAKVYRDEYMQCLSLKNKPYRWEANKGYPTREHRMAIKEYGTTIHHRKSFTLLPEIQLSLEI